MAYSDYRVIIVGVKCLCLSEPRLSTSCRLQPKSRSPTAPL